MENILDILPYEILLNIFNDVKDLRKYLVLNKKFNYIIKSIFEYYENSYSKIIEKWNLYPKKLINTLMKTNKHDELVFLINNYKINDIYRYIGRFAALYNNKYFLELSQKNGFYNYYVILKQAAKGGHLDLVKYAYNKGAKNIEAILYNAAKGGHIHIINEYIYSNYGLYIEILRGAMIGGFLNIIYSMEDKSDNANTLMNLLIFAAKGNQLKVIETIINNKIEAMNLNKSEFLNIYRSTIFSIIYNAAYTGHYNIVEWFINTFNLTLNDSYLEMSASAIGNLDIIINHGCIVPQEMANIAALYGNIDVVKYLLKTCLKEPSNAQLNEIARNASIGGYIDIIKYIYNEYPNFVINDIVAFSASTYGYLSIVEFILNKTNDFSSIERIFLSAARSGYLDIIIKYKNYINESIARKIILYADYEKNYYIINYIRELVSLHYSYR